MENEEHTRKLEHKGIHHTGWQNQTDPDSQKDPTPWSLWFCPFLDSTSDIVSKTNSRNDLKPEPVERKKYGTKIRDWRIEGIWIYSFRRVDERRIRKINGQKFLLLNLNQEIVRGFHWVLWKPHVNTRVCKFTYST